MKVMSLILTGITAVLIPTDCGRETEISGNARDSILVFAEPAADSIVNGLNDNDYSAFSQYFDEQMKVSLSEKVFAQTRERITGKIGRYRSRDVSRVIRKDQFIIVYYNAVFENESDVEVKVVFQKYGEKNLVSGLWFNSPGLREY